MSITMLWRVMLEPEIRGNSVKLILSLFKSITFCLHGFLGIYFDLFKYYIEIAASSKIS